MLREAAREIVKTLERAGYQALFAGGCVRDRLLGREPEDYDIATSATPDQVEAIFRRAVGVGRHFGVMIVPYNGHDFEVATFRRDEGYDDGRHPRKVVFTDAVEDAHRRDFTINAMFEEVSTGQIIDHVGGRADLAAGVIRTVGNPEARFGEDRLRLLRAVRFAARFDFTIDPPTMAAIRRHAASITEISAERIGDEMVKMLTEGRVRRAFELLDESGLLALILPQMSDMKDCTQPPDHHPEGDVFEHTLRALDQLTGDCSPTLALGVLLHDVAKPACRMTKGDRIVFYGHTGRGAVMAGEFCERLRLSRRDSERVVFLVDQHLRHCSAAEMRPATLKRFLRQDGIEELLELTRIDAMAANGDLSHYEFCMNALGTIEEEELRPRPLVSGHDLIGMGLEPGPLFKKILSVVEEAQLNREVSSRDEALALVRSRYLGKP